MKKPRWIAWAAAGAAIATLAGCVVAPLGPPPPRYGHGYGPGYGPPPGAVVVVPAPPPRGWGPGRYRDGYRDGDRRRY